MKKTILTLIYILLFASVPLMAQESTKTVRNLVVDGNKLFEAGQYHAALENYEKALALNPSFQYALYNKAVTLTKLASDDNKGTENDPRVQAAKIFKELASLDTNHDIAAKSFYNLGNMAFNDNQFGEAIKMYKGSLRINPDNKECRQNLLLALQKQDEEQNEDNQEQQQQEQEQEQEQQQQQQQQEQEQQQQPQEQPMTQSAEQLLQTMQNKENATRRRTNQQQAQPANRATDKPW